ncbi:MAG TPA: hypothetical protein VGF55_27210 [Gemmataceae bacterium]
MEILVRIAPNEPLGTKLDPSNPNVLIVTLTRSDVNQLVTVLRMTDRATLPPGSVTAVRFSGANTAQLRRQLVHDGLKPLVRDPVLAGRRMFAPGARAR